MNSREKGFLLLTSHLGDPNRKILTTAQLRNLASRVKLMDAPTQERDLSEKDLAGLGYGPEQARRILSLLEDDALLEHYCSRGRRLGCVPVTRLSEQYPVLLRQRLGLDSPGCLWAKGDISLLGKPSIALVGSRDLNPANRFFARAVGRMAAERGWVLVSGNARGADRAAQDACLQAGGRVISIVADALEQQPASRNLLYLSEDGFEEPFSAQRALSRNRCIHALGQTVFVAQCGHRKGGTWDGTVKNLQFGWSSVACFRDGSEASRELEQMGAFLIGTEDLLDFSGFAEPEMRFL